MSSTKGCWISSPVGKLLISKNDKAKQVKATDYSPVGSYPIVDQSSDFICGYHDDSAKVIDTDLPITVFGDHTRHTKFIHFPFIAGADGTQLLKARQGIDDKFFFYLVTLAAARIGNYGYDRHFKHLREFHCEYPKDKPEQTKIAEILSTVDWVIEQTETLIAKQQRIKTGLMQDLLTRGIDEHGNLRSEQTHPFKDSSLGRIPVEWEVGDLETVAEFVTSGSRGWAQYYAADGAIFLRIGNLTRNHINLRLDDIVLVNPPKSSEGKRTSLSAGDLLVSITADLGVIGVIPEGFVEAYVNQHIALVRLMRAKVNPRFIGWFLSSHRGQTQFQKLNESGAKAGLNLPTVRSLLLPMMELSEQTRIAEILDLNTEKTNSYHFRLTKLRSLKTALMQDLLTGKRRVTPLLEAEAVQ